jgi:ABC-type sulfate transport system permease subunit
VAVVLDCQFALFVFAIEIGATGFVPGVNDPDTALLIMLTCLGVELIVLPLTFVSGFAHDITMRPDLTGL